MPLFKLTTMAIPLFIVVAVKWDKVSAPAAPPRRPYCPLGRSKTYRQHIISSSRKHEIEGEKCLDLMVTCWTHTEPGSSQLRRKHGQGSGQNQPTRCGNELRLTCRWSPGHMRRYPSSYCPFAEAVLSLLDLKTLEAGSSI